MNEKDDDAVPRGELPRTELWAVEKRIKRGELWMILITALTALIALFGVLMSGLQWSVMRAQLRQAQDAQDRALLGPYSFDFNQSPSQDGSKTATFMWANFGKAPAYEVTNHYDVRFTDIPFDDDKALGKFIEETKACDNVAPTKGVMTAFPGAIHSVPFIFGNNPKVNAGEQTIVVQYCLAYTTNGVAHKTSSCFRWNGKVLLNRFLSCPAGNSSD